MPPNELPGASVAHVLGQVLLDDGAVWRWWLTWAMSLPPDADGLVEGQCDGARGDVERAARHDLVTAVDGDGNDGQAELQRQFKGTVLEGSHLARVGAAALRKDDNRHPRWPTFGGGHGVAAGPVPSGCRPEWAGQYYAASGADDGDVGQALARHPLEVVAQVAVHREDVIGTLMIGNKHVTGLVVHMLASLHTHAHEVQPAPQPGPPLGREIPPVVLAEQASHDSYQRCHNADHQHNGRHDAPLVYAV